MFKFRKQQAEDIIAGIKLPFIEGQLSKTEKELDKWRKVCLDCKKYRLAQPVGTMYGVPMLIITQREYDQLRGIQ